mgnify:CR=1 FL=1
MNSEFSDRELQDLVTSFKHLKKKRKVWLKTENGKWCSTKFNQRYWLSRFPLEIRRKILALAGPSNIAKPRRILAL